jgi:hypothetical protein
MKQIYVVLVLRLSIFLQRERMHLMRTAASC